MSRISPLEVTAAPGKAQRLLAGLHAKLEFVPNLFRVTAHSPAALDGLLQFSGALSGGILPARLNEQIALTVAEFNRCDYCLAAHTALGRQAGLTALDIARARRGKALEAKTEAALGFALSLVSQRGKIEQVRFDQMRQVGWQDGEIVEIIARVALNIYTNYLNGALETEIDFPAVETGDGLHPVLRVGQMGGFKMRNRAVVAPMSRVSTRGDGVPTVAMADYYASFAQGGFGLIIAEGTYTDQAFSQGYANQPGIVTAAQADGWRRVTEAVKGWRGRIFLQLMHAGALSQYLSVTRAPSALPPKGKMLDGYGGNGPFRRPEEMSTSEMASVRNSFVASAQLATESGFDGVEIHAANGYLFDQFLTEYTNQRTDAYGGSLSNRLRFIVEIISAVKQAVTGNFVVGVRLSQGKVNDFHYHWPGGENDGRTIFSAVADAGADYIHFATEGNGYREGSFTDEGVSLPRLARDITGLPIIANGGLHDEVLSRHLLEAGEADYISLGTGALANPDWPALLAAGKKARPVSADILAKGVTISQT